MKKAFLFSILILLSSVRVMAQETTPEATENPNTITIPEPNYSVEGDGVVLDVYFNSLRQGRAGLLGLRGEGITGGSATVSIKTVEFFQLEGRDGWWAIIALDMNQTIRQTDMTVTVELENQDDPQILLTRFNVITGGFISQEVNLIPDEATMRLLEPEVEAAEFEIIFGIATQVTEEALWGENSFIPPSATAELTSPFGASRVFNEELRTVHTGWDFNAATGTPLLSTAAGQVAFAGRLDIRGNYVLVNHGRGIYSGYAHMSVVYVTQGQNISEGQVLGLVGSTGRSSSAHAHFEMIANGVWVDSADFVSMYIP